MQPFHQQPVLPPAFRTQTLMRTALLRESTCSKYHDGIRNFMEASLCFPLPSSLFRWSIPIRHRHLLPRSPSWPPIPCPRKPYKVPLAMAYCSNHHTLVTASADMTLLQWNLDDVPAIKHFTLKSRWPTKHAAMSMSWSSSHRLLYSGTTAGTIQGKCERVHLREGCRRRRAL